MIKIAIINSGEAVLGPRPKTERNDDLTENVWRR